jgi:hypothetical protein
MKKGLLPNLICSEAFNLTASCEDLRFRSVAHSQHQIIAKEGRCCNTFQAAQLKSPSSSIADAGDIPRAHRVERQPVLKEKRPV